MRSSTLKTHMRRHFDARDAKDQTVDPTESEKDMFARNVFGNNGEQRKRIVKAHRKSRLRELNIETNVKCLIKDGFEPPKISFPTTSKPSQSKFFF